MAGRKAIRIIIYEISPIIANQQINEGRGKQKDKRVCKRTCESRPGM